MAKILPPIAAHLGPTSPSLPLEIARSLPDKGISGPLAQLDRAADF